MAVHATEPRKRISPQVSWRVAIGTVVVVCAVVGCFLLFQGSQKRVVDEILEVQKTTAEMLDYQNYHGHLPADLSKVGVRSRTDASLTAFSGSGAPLNGKTSFSSGPNTLPKDVIVLLGWHGSEKVRQTYPESRLVDMAHFSGSISQFLNSDRDVVVLFGDLSIWVLSKNTPASAVANFCGLDSAPKHSRDKLRAWLVMIAKEPYSANANP